MAKETTKKRAKSKTGASVLWRIWKIIWIPLFCVIFLYVGLYIGYVKLGGQPSSEIWQAGTWKHLYDLVFAD